MNAANLEPQELRSLLAQLLRSDPEFDAFCLDAFPSIHRRFSRGMERVEKENLLLLHAPSREDVAAALRKLFPKAAAWHGAEVFEPSKTPRRASILVASLLGVALLAGFFWRVRFSPVTQERKDAVRTRAASASACGALLIDDVFVAKGTGKPPEQPILLDVRLRHSGNGVAPVNITRAVVECGEKTPERSPYEPSASYDLLISGVHNEAAIAQRLGTDEIDRMLIRLGFTNESAGYQYAAKLRLVYNGGCVVESAPFALSRDAARYVGF